MRGTNITNIYGKNIIWNMELPNGMQLGTLFFIWNIFVVKPANTHTLAPVKTKKKRKRAR